MPDRHPAGASGPPPADSLATLIRSLRDAQRLSPLDRARAIPGLIDQAKKHLSAARADAMIELTGGMKQADLARELGISPAAVNNAIKGRRDALRSPS